ncbi:hypothetical protein SCORR_v1c10290 (plasmid) [Spiroplasma corruscae]|uniref:TraG P-loop domain-containing protein n=1 Tax=Spiroplasma corruscae TaxID=216934 RepID=A0A222EQY0_9MOLU|nr:hypothetical protein [Spiroplasma corruscae]ASP28801.1 hypothetical protein SCORR_v1c10290 [Spiroplasma corruscae]
MKKKEIKKDNYMISYQIMGKDLISLSDLEIQSIFGYLSNMYDHLTERIDIVKVIKPLEQNGMLDFYQELIDVYQKEQKKHEPSSDEFIRLSRKIEQINGYQKQYSKLFEDNIEFVKEYNIVFYSNDLGEIKSACQTFEKQMRSAKYEIKRNDSYNSINLCQRLVSPTATDISPEDIIKNKNNLKEILSFNNIDFKSDYYKINDFYYKVNAICEYPSKVYAGWLNQLVFSDCNFVVSLDKLDYNTQSKIINSNNMVNMINFHGLTDRQKQEQNELAEDAELIDQISMNIANGKEKLFKMSVLFLLESDNVDELFNRNDEIINNLSQFEINVDEFKYRQQQGLGLFMLKPDKVFPKNISTIVPSSTIAIADIFISSELNHENSLTLGVNEMGEYIYWSPFVKPGGIYKAHNGTVLGSIGGGKSFFAKKVSNFINATGNKNIIIDPEAEFLGLAKYFKGKVINVGSGVGEMQNILQIIPQLEDEELIDENSISSTFEDKLNKYISDHIVKINIFFKFLYPEWNEMMLSFLRDSAIKMYKNMSFNTNYKNIEDIPAKKWPIISDLIRQLEIIDKSNLITVQIKELQNMLLVLKTDFENNGMYQNLFNGWSNINIKDNDFIVFNVKQLIDKKSDIGLLNASMLLVFDLIYSEMSRLRLKNDKLLPLIAKDKGYKNKMDAYHFIQKIMIMVDEFHLFIDADNPYTIQQFATIAKRCRKYYTGIIQLTQQVKDLFDYRVEKYSSACVENSQFKMLFALGSNDIMKVKNLFESTGKGISEYDEVFLANAQQGSGLFFYNQKDSIRLFVKATETEKEAIEFR